MAAVDVIGRIEASVQDGGWKASGAVFNDADRLEFYQEIESWFDLYASGWERLPRPAFRGHLLPDRWRKTFQSSEAPWAAFTAQEFMKRGKIQGIYYKNVASAPANNHQIVSMTYAKIIKEILGNVGEYGHWNGVRGVWPEGICTLNIDTANSSSVAEYEVKEGNFWSRLQEIAAIDFYLFFVDKTNRINAIPHPMFDASLPSASLTITSSLLLEPLEFEQRNTEQVGQVKLHGTTPSGTQITGKYPTDPTAGPIVVRAGYMATAASLMTTIATRMYKFENRDYVVTARLPGAIGLMLELLDRIAITYTSTPDGIAWSSKKFWINQISVELLSNFTARTELSLDAEST